MDVVTAGIALLQYVPDLVKYFTGSDKDKETAQKLVDVASKVTGKEQPDQAIAALQANPEAVLKFKEAAMNLELELEKLAASNANTVNATMVAESQSEHWPQYSWRPAIGFSVAIAVLLSVLTVFTAYVAAVFTGNARGLESLPGILTAVAGIIAMVSPILGIASWFRGKKQAAEVIG